MPAHAPSMMAERRIYRVQFVSQGQVYEIFVRHVAQGGIFGFVEVEEILFGERSQVVVDPSEEQLKHEFDGVQRSYIPMHAILRIDEVSKEGVGRIRKSEGDGGTLTAFPVPVPKPD